MRPTYRLTSSTPPWRIGLTGEIPSELSGSIHRFLHERRQSLDRWFFALRTAFAVGVAGFLAVDAVEGTHPKLLIVLAAYLAANAAVWLTVAGRRSFARWIYAFIDLSTVLVLRHVFAAEILVDPNATAVALFTLLLLAYAVYGDPKLSGVLSVLTLGATCITVGLDLFNSAADSMDPFMYRKYPLRILLIVSYLGAFCVLTIALAHGLHRRIVEYAEELHKRLETSMTSALERNRREKLEELNRLKRDFMSVLSHELRTPLTPLRSSLQLLHGHDSAASTEELLGIALESTDKLQRLVQDYTHLAELLTETEPGFTRWNFKLVCLVNVLRDESDFRRVATQGFEDLSVVGDPGLLATALLALIRRAQLISPSTISLYAGAQGSWITLSVHDCDSYLDPGLTELLDDPFGISCERMFDSANTGLELVLARYSLQRMGGMLHISSEKNDGTTVSCVLPSDEPGVPWLDEALLRFELGSTRFEPTASTFQWS